MYWGYGFQAHTILERFTKLLLWLVCVFLACGFFGATDRYLGRKMDPFCRCQGTTPLLKWLQLLLPTRIFILIFPGFYYMGRESVADVLLCPWSRRLGETCSIDCGPYFSHCWTLSSVACVLLTLHNVGLGEPNTSFILFGMDVLPVYTSLGTIVPNKW